MGGDGDGEERRRPMKRDRRRKSERTEHGDVQTDMREKDENHARQRRERTDIKPQALKPKVEKGFKVDGYVTLIWTQRRAESFCHFY